MAQLKAIEEVYQNDKNNLDFYYSYKNNFNFEIGINKEIFPKKVGKENLVQWIGL